MNVKMWRMIRSLVLFAGITTLTACADDDECRTCKNMDTDYEWEACGDELTEARTMDNITCR